MKTDKPVILIFSDWYAPGFKAGGPIQSCVNLVRYLSDKYRFYVVCGDRDLGDDKPYKNIPLNKWSIGPSGETIFYTDSRKLSRQQIRRFITELNPQVVYLNSMFSIPFTILPLLVCWKLKNRPLVVLAPRGMLQAGALQLKATRKKIFLRIFRVLGWQQFIRFQATDAQELKDIQQQFPSASALIAENIPNCLSANPSPATKEPGKLNLIFISRIHPKKNLLFLLELLKEWPGNAQLTVDIYGDAGDPAYDSQCKSLVGQLPPDKVVRFMGPIENKLVFATLAAYHAFVLPTRGENFGHAIFEALEAGKPVLISDQTPWRNLEERNAGWDIPLDRKDRYWKALDQLAAMDQTAYEQWSANARSLAQQYVKQAGFQTKYLDLFA
jgi:glycosyltransferase involved in cell wall biosynthesis